LNPNHTPIERQKAGPKNGKIDTILYFGTYEETYSRNRILIKSLRAMGYHVKECHVSLWQNKVDKSGVLRGSGLIFFLIHLLSLYPRLIFKYLFAGHHDVIFVGYFGHLDILIIRLLCLIIFRRKKIVFDAFISLYDSIVQDRKMVKPRSIFSGIIFLLDRVSCFFADAVLLDTNEHIDFFHKKLNVPKDKMFRVLANAETDVFYFREGKKEEDSKCRILFMGKYTPLHGIEYIVEAAEMLQHDDSVEFIFIGKGQLHSKIQMVVAEKKINNIRFIDWVEYKELPAYIANADICLGIFSKSSKAQRVIPNKVFQAMAMGKSVITADTPGIAELLTHGYNAILCNPADPVGLYEAIIRLKGDPLLRKKIGENALASFKDLAGDQETTASLQKVINFLSE